MQFSTPVFHVLFKYLAILSRAPEKLGISAVIFLVIVFTIWWILLGFVVGIIIGVTIYCTASKIALVLRFSWSCPNFVIHYCVFSWFFILIATWNLIEAAFKSSAGLPRKLTRPSQAVWYARHPTRINSDADQATWSSWAYASEGRGAWAGTSALTRNFATLGETWGSYTWSWVVRLT